LAEHAFGFHCVFHQAAAANTNHRACHNCCYCLFRWVVAYFPPTRTQTAIWSLSLRSVASPQPDALSTNSNETVIWIWSLLLIEVKQQRLVGVSAMLQFAISQKDPSPPRVTVYYLLWIEACADRSESCSDPCRTQLQV
jgi:hypothetical protein